MGIQMLVQFLERKRIVQSILTFNSILLDISDIFETHCS